MATGWEHGERSWGRAARDALPVVAVFAVCPLVALLAPDDPAAAIARGRDLVDLERSLGVLVEPSLARWTAGHAVLLQVLTWLYLLVHVPATVGALVWAWLERRAAFARARAALLGTQAVVVAGYLALPTAPPRLLPGLGVGDPLAAVGASDAGLSSVLQSPYAAVPSGHVAFSVVVAWIVVRLAGPPWVRLLVGLYPLGVVAMVVLTGNHLLSDAVLGASAATVGIGASGLALRFAHAPSRVRRRRGWAAPRTWLRT